MTEKKNNRLIHVGRMQEPKHGTISMLLREMAPKQYKWFKKFSNNQEIETSIQAETIEEALRLANQKWKDKSFRTLICGFRYTLPERDEHGTNALFHQMAASYASMNGIYFDEELSANCIVHNASNEARSFLKKLQLESQV